MRRVPFFEHLTESEAFALSGEFKKRSFNRSEYLVVAGEKSDVLYVILSGTANVTLDHTDGRKLVLATLGAGDVLGEMSLVDGEPHFANVIATKRVDTLTLTREGFHFCMKNNHKMAMALMRSLVSRLRNANQKVMSLAMYGVYDRVARYLLEIAVEKDEGQMVIDQKISHASIAREVNASREMVSRAMKGFESSAFIRKTESGRLLVANRRTKSRE